VVWDDPSSWANTVIWGSNTIGVSNGETVIWGSTSGMSPATAAWSNLDPGATRGLTFGVAVVLPKR
jgi:hypothetical protein